MPFYAVAMGHKVGIYESWSNCEKMVKGFKGARYKKFSTKKEAQKFIDEHKTITMQAATLDHNTSPSFSASSINFKADIKETSGIHGTKRKHDDITQENNLLTNVQVVGSSVSASHNSDSSISNVSDVNVANIPIVYTDGACSNNGKHKGRNAPKAGYGVFWGDGHPDNTSAPVEGAPTNNRAEYTAVIVALQQAIRKSFPRVIIRTDSMLLINSLTMWRNAWKRNNWRKKDGTAVLNVDLLKQLDSLLGNIQVTFEHVKAHVGIHGNEMADELARRGAMLYGKNC